MAWNTQKLVRAYPDVWAAKAASGRGRRSDEMGSRWQDRSRELRRKQIQQVLLFGVLPLVLLIVGLSVIGKDESSDAGSPGNPYPLEKPTEPLVPTVERFEVAWNGSRHDDVKAFVAVSERPSR